jgi:hypothetical protein
MPSRLDVSISSLSRCEWATLGLSALGAAVLTFAANNSARIGGLFARLTVSVSSSISSRPKKTRTSLRSARTCISQPTKLRRTPSGSVKKQRSQINPLPPISKRASAEPPVCFHRPVTHLANARHQKKGHPKQVAFQKSAVAS